MHAGQRDILGETIPHTHAPRADSDTDAESRRAGEPKRERYAFASGARPLDGYTIKRAIGRGGFGEVYYAASDAGKEVALKLITRNLDIERRGVSHCMNLKCPNLIAIHDLRTTDEGDTFVIMEYVAGPSLANVLANHPNGLPLPEVRAWLKGMVDGVAYLHDHGVVHRDLKPANMFMEEGVVKIGDYGLSKSISMSQDRGHSESIGTCHYMAPEISSGKYHKPIDIYALGIILYEMLTGRVPFEGETVQEVLMRHLTSRPDLTGLPEPYRSLVARALAKDPNHRPISPYELLAPEDAPRGFTIPPRAGEPKSSNPKEDDVFRIPAEESVFYIGPNTLPPRPRPNRFERLRAIWAANERQTPQAARTFARRPVRRQPEPAPNPPIPATPPLLPGTRERAAELAQSMLAAAPLALIVPIGFNSVFHLLPRGSGMPEVFGFCLATLAATWGILIPCKIMERRAIADAAKRLIFLTIGVLIGAILARVADGGPYPMLPFAAAIGLAFAAPRWWKLTARDRPRRFQILSVIGTGLVASVLSGVFQGVRSFNESRVFLAAMAIAPFAAILAQVVGTRDRAAAAYALAIRRAGRSKTS